MKVFSSYSLLSVNTGAYHSVFWKFYINESNKRSCRRSRCAYGTLNAVTIFKKIYTVYIALQLVLYHCIDTVSNYRTERRQPFKPKIMFSNQKLKMRGFASQVLY